jgi:tryptophan 2,3-dioxygenase
MLTLPNLKYGADELLFTFEFLLFNFFLSPTRSPEHMIYFLLLNFYFLIFNKFVKIKPMALKPQYYSEYLELDKIIHAQHPVSFEPGNQPAHDEMLFIVIHQAYELWFKQMLFEVDSVLSIMSQSSINDNSSDLQTVVHRLNRVVKIMQVLVHQVDILETMTPMDFMDFRDMLRPASGFQSWQFKILEAKLGLKFDHRHGQEYYLSQLKAADVEIIKRAEDGISVIEGLNSWLERMPFIKDNDFWSHYEGIYEKSLNEAEATNKIGFKKIFHGDEAYSDRNLSPQACRAALFIMLYRGYPLLELPFQLLDVLLEIDNQMGNWRYRHLNMVRRMIGTRVGTGGSTGAGYLQGAMEKHYIFKEIAQLNSFLIERSKLPQLPKEMTEKMRFGS